MLTISLDSCRTELFLYSFCTNTQSPKVNPQTCSILVRFPNSQGCEEQATWLVQHPQSQYHQLAIEEKGQADDSDSGDETPPVLMIEVVWRNESCFVWALIVRDWGTFTPNVSAWIAHLHSSSSAPPRPSKGFASGSPSSLDWWCRIIELSYRQRCQWWVLHGH